MLDRLKSSSLREGSRYSEEFDLLIVGGGATGAGVAVDAASRGLKVALVDRDDFSAGEHHMIWPGPNERMRRVETRVDEFWGQCPLNSR